MMKADNERAGEVTAVPILSLNRVHKSFTTAATPAVVDLSFDVAEGEIVSLLGPSGCGKTTTLRCISGLESVTAGEISVAGRVVSSATVHVPPHRRHIGLVFQSYALWPHMTVDQNVRYGLEMLNVPRHEAKRRVGEALEVVGLSGLGSRLPSQLSGGQQQRVALARSLVVRPRLLLLDEPLSNLDAALRDHVRAQLRSILKSVGIASIYVTHDQREALSISDRIALMNLGTLMQIGDPLELYQAPANAFVAKFLGGANLLPVDRLTTTADRYVGECHGAGLMTGTMRVGVAPGEDVVAMVRREHIRITAGATGEEGGEGPNRLSGQVVDRVYEGWAVEYVVELGPHRVRVLTGDPSFRLADPVTLTIEREHVQFLPA